MTQKRMRVAGAIAALSGMTLLVILAWPLATYILGQLALSHAEATLVEHSEYSRLLIRGLLLIVGIPFVWALSEALRIPSLWGGSTVRRRSAGVVFTLSLAAYFLILYGVSRDMFFTRSGEPQKWCAETPEGLRCFDQPGYDPVYGLKLTPPTSEQVIAWKRQELGQVPTRVEIADIDDIEFFDRLQARSKLWYGTNRHGKIEFFDASGFHPSTGTKLQPVTPSVISAFEAQQDEKVRQAAEVRERAARQAPIEREHREALQQRQREVEAAREDRTRIARYVNPSARRDAPQIVIVDANGRFDPALGQRLASKLGGRIDLFKPAFVEDGLFASSYQGNTETLSSLELAGSKGPIFLGEASQSVQQSNYPEAGMYRAEVVLEVRRFDPTRNFGASLISARGIGAAFHETAALDRAQVQAIRAFMEDLQQGG